MKRLTLFEHLCAWFTAFVISNLVIMPMAMLFGEYSALGMALFVAPSIWYIVGSSSGE